MVVVFIKNYQTCLHGRFVSELQHPVPCSALCVWFHTRLRKDFWINYYTTTNLARQQLFCNLEVRVRIELTNNSFADCDITILSSHYNSGTACRNRTYILSLEDSCPVHWTNAVLVRVARIELARIAPRDFKSLVSTYFTILAITLLYPKQSCMSTGTPAQIRTERTSPFERDDFTNLSTGAWWADWELNSDSTDYESAALPLSYQPNTGGRCESRTHSAVFTTVRISNPLHYHPAHLPWHPMRESNSQLSVRSTVWYSFHQSGIGTSWQIRTADLLRVKETFYHWNNEAHNMAESRGVEPHPYFYRTQFSRLVAIPSSLHYSP